jgi:hypothetical protein
LFGLVAKWKRRPDRLTRLARELDRLAERDEKAVEEMDRADMARRHGARTLHAICADFTKHLNAAMTRTEMLLIPTVFDPLTYRDDAPNLIQMSLRGRIVQIQYEAPEQALATENFRYPYILHGAVNGFNQTLLDRDLIEEQLLFYARTGEKTDFRWHYFEPRTYRTGLVNEAYLTALLARLA